MTKKETLPSLVVQWIRKIRLPVQGTHTGSVPCPRGFHMPWSKESLCATTTEAAL